jgi:dihydropyrimidinase
MYTLGVKKERISLSRMVELIATAPAKQFGLYPRKGALKVGGHADIVLFDPEETWTMGEDSLHMAADWSAYEGMEMIGKIKKVFSRGELIIAGEECLAAKGRGRYLQRRL